MAKRGLCWRRPALLPPRAPALTYLALLPPAQGLAACLGFCAVTHLDEVLAKLEDFVKSDVFKKSAGLFSIFKVGTLLPWGRPLGGGSLPLTFPALPPRTAATTR